MQFARISKALVGVAVLALTSAAVFADVYDKKTILKVNETIEVPGAVLPPGEYVVKLVDSQANRHIVRFLNKEENEVLSTVIAIPNSRMKPSGKTEFEWHETPAGQPPALKAWFYPGDTFGQEFAYPERRAAELSAATQQEVAHVSDQEAAAAAKQATQETVIAQAPAPRSQPDNSAAQREAAQARERELAAQRQRERQLAQAAQNQQRNADPSLTAQQTQQSTSTGNELPETAGLGALLALIGLGSLGASQAVRKLRNK
jgi:hypothetical protein